MRESFGDYKVLDRVGAGGKAEVFRARDTRAGRTTAIKVLTADIAMDPVLGAPFVDEAYLAARLGHPNAAALYDIGEQDGRPHLVYEFVQGQTLKALLGGRPINARRALEFAIQIADALAEAHALGLVHGSLRPDKVLVSQKGIAKVIDFGLGRYAIAVARQHGSSLDPGAVAYWAPELHQGAADARADIYALGLLLTEMLTGQSPPADGRPPAAAVLADIESLLVPAIARATATEPEARFASAATFAAALREQLAALMSRREGEAPASTSGSVSATQSACGTVRRSSPRWLIAGSGVALLLFAWWWLVR